MIFIIGAPSRWLAIAALWLPESLRFLVARANLAPRHRTLLRRAEIGFAMTGPIARLNRNSVLERARSARVNHARISAILQVNTPPSASP
jgi:hypothetical protein